MQNQSDIEASRQLDGLELGLSPRISYRLETVFSRSAGISLERAIDSKLDLVKRCEPVLEQALLNAEQVLLVTLGELQFQKTILVLTNLRLLLFSTDRSQTPWQPYWMVYYSQITELKQNLFRQPQFRLRDGKKLNFNDFPEQDRQALVEVFAEAAKRFEEEGLDPPVSQSKENLCSHCLEVVPQERYECDVCGATFWTPFDLGIRSFLFLPLGIFAIRNTRVVVKEMLLYVLLLFFVVLWQAQGDTTFAIVTFVLTSAGYGEWMFKLASRGLYLRETPET